jgi:ethanolamine utilization protein EutQ (cupin superfamily)
MEVEMKRRKFVAIPTMAFLAAALCFALGGALAEPTDATASKPYQLSTKGYETLKAGEHGQVDLYTPVKNPNMSAGWARWRKGESLIKWPYWYEETIYVTHGEGRITVSHAPFESHKVYNVKPGDMLYFAKGSQVTFEPVSEDAFEILYVTTPNPLP